MRIYLHNMPQHRPISIIGFGLRWLSSLIRVPNPPAKIIVFISRILYVLTQQLLCYLYNRDFSVLRTLEITTYIRKSGYRPVLLMSVYPSDRYSALTVNSLALYLLMGLLYHSILFHATIICIRALFTRILKPKCSYSFNKLRHRV